MPVTFSWTFTPSPPSSPTVPVQFQSTLAQSVVDFGKDVFVFVPGLDAAMQESNDIKLVGEMLLRRLSTPRGKLRFHPEAGTDLRMYLNEAITDDVLARIKHDVETEALQDERIEACDARVSYRSDTRAITISATVTTADGPFVYTIQVTQLTAVLLSTEEA